MITSLNSLYNPEERLIFLFFLEIATFKRLSSTKSSVGFYCISVFERHLVDGRHFEFEARATCAIF